MRFDVVIKQWKINHTLLAQKLNLNKTTFNYKLKSVPNSFTKQERKKLTTVLQEMKMDLEKVIS